MLSLHLSMQQSMRVAEKYSSENLTTTALPSYLVNNVSRKNMEVLIMHIVEVVIILYEPLQLHTEEVYVHYKALLCCSCQ